ncbi:tripartite tricarboxylate transporter TctB family protein [Pelomonas sp. CA6]|uniref:tripartite tricarboxylate transporter TctB family protein n=1 Tax=Pelomonas sp. CA6 TaxID=2907999 RepID=UPI001F4C2951|nr:tripartite tricarboxylate transporter TctB family protein [Pelomonas sp. CA6]MCH7343972.1 tripartite tricarboxylate transporter TctB family protein [Pelomonas sp. CA6]
MKIKSQRDFWSGLLFIVVGAAFAWGATEYSFGSSAKPGPGYFPFGLGVLLSVLGALVLFGALTIEARDGDPVGPFAWRPLLVVVGSIVLFGALLPRLGLVVALPALIIVAALASDEFHWKDALISSVVLTLASWGIFVWGLKLSLPMWPTVALG